MRRFRLVGGNYRVTKIERSLSWDEEKVLKICFQFSSKLRLKLFSCWEAILFDKWGYLLSCRIILRLSTREGKKVKNRPVFKLNRQLLNFGSSRSNYATKVSSLCFLIAGWFKAKTLSRQICFFCVVRRRKRRQISFLWVQHEGATKALGSMIEFHSLVREKFVSLFCGRSVGRSATFRCQDLRGGFGKNFFLLEQREKLLLVRLSERPQSYLPLITACSKHENRKATKTTTL